MKNWMLLLISVFIALLSCEVVVRFMIDAWPFEDALYVQNHLTARDLTLRWRPPPSKGRNSLGLRNREVYPKEDGVYRILFLGDSLIWSGETNSGKLHTEVLEYRLNTYSKNRSFSYEVINAGIPGYNTYQELEFLKIYGLDMKPDLVILSFVFNDLYYKYLHKPTKEKILDVEPTRHLHHFNINIFPINMLARSYLAHSIVWKGEILWRRILQKTVFPFERQGDFYLAWKDYGWMHIRELIGEMQKLLSDKGISLLVVVFPISDQVNERYRIVNSKYVLYPQSIINNICVNYDIPMLDLTDSLYMNGGIILFQDYLHLNADGNDVVVDELEKLQSNYQFDNVSIDYDIKLEA
jgi:lysophospholipase L1-like esterase